MVEYVVGAIVDVSKAKSFLKQPASYLFELEVQNVVFKMNKQQQINDEKQWRTTTICSDGTLSGDFSTSLFYLYIKEEVACNKVHSGPLQLDASSLSMDLCSICAIVSMLALETYFNVFDIPVRSNSIGDCCQGVSLGYTDLIGNVLAFGSLAGNQYACNVVEWPPPMVSYWVLSLANLEPAVRYITCFDPGGLQAFIILQTVRDGVILISSFKVLSKACPLCLGHTTAGDTRTGGMILLCTSSLALQCIRNPQSIFFPLNSSVIQPPSVPPLLQLNLTIDSDHANDMDEHLQSAAVNTGHIPFQPVKIKCRVKGTTFYVFDDAVTLLDGQLFQECIVRSMNSIYCPRSHTTGGSSTIPWLSNLDWEYTRQGFLSLRVNCCIILGVFFCSCLGLQYILSFLAPYYQLVVKGCIGGYFWQCCSFFILADVLHSSSCTPGDIAL